ncbi:MAG: tetratricopeptide repeat protein [Bacteroidota bacterium]
MSQRKGKPSKKKTNKKATKKVAAKPRVSAKPKVQLQLPAVPALLARLNARHFWYVFGVLAVVTFLLASRSGVNEDDNYQIDYSDKLLAYYTTMGQDTSALYVEKGNMHYYGGFFEVLSGGTTAALGLHVDNPDYHVVRHLWVALFGLLTMLFVALTVKRLVGWHGALLALILMFLSPRFLGHSLMNPKDIPFACGYMMALYFSCRWLDEIPKVSWPTLLGLGAGIMIAISTRVGGFLAVGNLGLFAVIAFAIGVGKIPKAERSKYFLSYLGYGTIPVVGGIIAALLFWPYALADPIAHVQEALGAFSKFGTGIRMLYDGSNIMSTTVPEGYLFQWLWMSLPIFTLLGFVGALACLPYLVRRINGLSLGMILFAAVFPLVYIALKDSVLYDGLRHLLFIVPPVMVLVGIFWTLALRYALAGSQAVKIGGIALLAVLLIEPAIFIARNSTHPYVYFNPLAGGVSGAYGEYELEYWGVSAKQAVEWLEAQGKLNPPPGDTLKIGTNFYFSVSKYLRRDHKGKAKTVYVRHHQRFDQDWDYGIFINRYIDGPHLRAGTWPTSRTIHTIDANGKPICAIYERKSDQAFTGRAAEKRGDFVTAVTAYQAEVATHPDNELAWVGLANASLNTGNFATTESAARKAIEILPEYANAQYYLALSAMYQQRVDQAIPLFQQVIDWDDRFYLAHYFLATIYKDRQDLQTALGYANKVIEINPRFKQGYLLLAEIFDQANNAELAAKYRSAAASL